MKYKFENAEQMLNFVQDGNDLYSPKGNIYVFLYNINGSICTYSITNEESLELASLSKKSEESSWSAFLGHNGLIWDDPTHPLYSKDVISNLEKCYELIKYDDWMLTENILVA